MVVKRMPAQIIAGDSLSLEIGLSGFTTAAGDAVSLTLTPMAGGTPLAIIADGGVTEWTIELGSSVSVNLVPGQYRFLLASVNSGNRSTIEFGEVVVLPDPSASEDQRSSAQRALDAIDAVLEDRAGSPDLKYEFEDGRSVEMVPHRELIELRKHYARRVANEKRGARGPSRVQVRL